MLAIHDGCYVRIPRRRELDLTRYPFLQWRDACAVLVYSSFLALVTSVFIEAPIVAIQKICTPRERNNEGRRRQKTHHEVQEQREQDPVQLQFQEKMTRTVAEDAELTEIKTCSPEPPEYDASYL